jgi:Kef-type K+ transport system membrane component KefB
MTVYRSPKTGKPVSRAGFAYGALWTVVIGARAAFSYGSLHWFAPQLGRWMAQHSVTSAAITDALILMAVTMLLTRVLGLGVRAAKLNAGADVDSYHSRSKVGV